MGIHAAGHRLSLLFCEGICCHGDNWYGLAIRMGKISDLPCGFQSIHIRHHNVHKDHIVISRRGCFHLVYGNLTIEGKFNQNTVIFKNCLNDLLVQLIILGNKNAFSFQIDRFFG